MHKYRMAHLLGLAIATAGQAWAVETSNGGGGPWVAGQPLNTEVQPAPGQIGISPSAVPVVVADPATVRVPRTDETENPVPERSTRVAEAPRLLATEGKDVWPTTTLTVVQQEQRDIDAQIANPVTGVTVTPATSTGAVNSTVQLSAAVAPAAAAKSIIWTTSDATKATVDSKGLVTRKATGTATITGTSAVDGSKKGTSTITIS